MTLMTIQHTYGDLGDQPRRLLNIFVLYLIMQVVVIYFDNELL